MNSLFRHRVWSILFLTAVLSGETLATCVDFGRHINWLATMRTEDCYWFENFVIHDNSVWAVGLTGELYVFDISDPTLPTLHVRHDLAGKGTKIFGRDNLALLSLDDDKVLVLDLADPMQLVISDTLATPMPVSDVAFRGELAYVTTTDQGLQILDLSDPSSVVSAGSWRAGGLASHVELAANEALIVMDGQLFTLSLADPLAPVATDSLVTRGQKIFVDGDALYMEASLVFGFDVYDIVPGQPLAFQYNVRTVAPIQFITRAGEMLAVKTSDRLHLYEFLPDDTVAPLIEFGSGFPLVSERIVSYGNLLFFTGDPGVTILDMGDGRPVPVADPLAVPHPGYSGQMVTRGEYALVAGGAAGLVVYDVSDPMLPNLVAADNSLGEVNNIALSGETAFLFGGALYAVYDVADPASPQLSFASFDLDFDIKYGVIADDILWGAGRYQGVYGIDISDPAAPYVRYEVSGQDYLTYVAAHSGLLHVLGAAGVYEIYSLSAEPPLLLSTFDTADWNHCLAFAGDFAFFGGSAAIQIIDLSDPTSPQVINRYPLAGPASDISIHGNRAVISSDRGGLLTLDISDLTSIRNLGTVMGRYSGHSVLETGAVVTYGLYAIPGSGMSTGLRVVPESCEWTAPVVAAVPKKGVEILAAPNPFNPRTVISFELPASGSCTLAVYDLQGRLVKRLCQEYRERGLQKFIWDGRDVDGQAVASGVFMARLVYQGVVGSSKLVLLR